MTRVALDTVRAGVAHPDVVRGAIRAVRSDPDLHLLLVGPEDSLRRAVDGAGADVPRTRVDTVDAARSVGPDDDPVVTVRGRADASIRVAIGLLQRREADAVVSAGPAAATVAAARFSLGRLPGMRQPAIAAEVTPPGSARRLLIVDAGAQPDATAAALVRFGELGAELASHRGTPAPRIAALAPLGMTARARTELETLFRAADLGAATFVGPVTTAEALAGDVDVLVSAGASGRIVVDTVVAGATGSGSHGVLVGTDATVAVLESTRADAVSEAVADVARLARRVEETV